MIIGVSGDINSGKDLVGRMVQYLNSSYSKMYGFKDWKHRVEVNGSSTNSPVQIRKFADKLKDIVCLLLNCTRAQLEDRIFKETPLGEEWWVFTDGISMTPFIGGDRRMLDGYNTRVQKTTPRLLLQLLGTDCGREMIHPNIWVNSLMSEYKEVEKSRPAFDVRGIPATKREHFKELPYWVITDVRFPNEADIIKAKKGIVLRVQRPATDVQDRKNLHLSETALDTYQFNGILKNDTDLEGLLNQVRLYV